MPASQFAQLERKRLRVAAGQPAHDLERIRVGHRGSPSGCFFTYTIFRRRAFSFVACHLCRMSDISLLYTSKSRLNASISSCVAPCGGPSTMIVVSWSSPGSVGSPITLSFSSVVLLFLDVLDLPQPRFECRVIFLQHARHVALEAFERRIEPCDGLGVGILGRSFDDDRGLLIFAWIGGITHVVSPFCR